MHQAERDQGGSVKNWNVIALTDLGGKLVERYVYTPYGQVSVFQESGFGDREGDQDVDSTDKGTPGSTCSGGAFVGACRVLDLDFDGDYDSSDGTLFDSLESGVMVRPGGSATNLNQPFAHQGLLHDAEVASYQNRARQYVPGLRRFTRHDPQEYIDSLSLYSYLVDNPLIHVDPHGLTIGFGDGQVCFDANCGSPPSGGSSPIHVIPENPPPAYGPPTSGCQPADGIVINGKIHKVSNGCTINVTCSGGSPTLSWAGTGCGIGCGCQACPSGSTICEERCVEWRTVVTRCGTHETCVRYQDFPTPPFVGVPDHGGDSCNQPCSCF
jgi:RHS repeat-associated protein